MQMAAEALSRHAEPPFILSATTSGVVQPDGHASNSTGLPLGASGLGYHNRL